MKKLSVALIGYGKMGKIIESICIERGHTIHCIIDKADDFITQSQLFSTADVAIDFSLPEAVTDNIHNCFNMHIPVVVGTTGWHNQLPEITTLCIEKNGSLFYASNYSLGMNIVFRLNQQLAKMLKGTNYKISIKESHHIQKLDAPSGTAITLANDVIKNHKGFKKWVIGTDAIEGILPIEVQRIGEVNGVHEIKAVSEEDTISLRHEAFSRKGFALGAVLAAEFLYDKKGVFSMDDLLKV